MADRYEEIARGIAARHIRGKHPESTHAQMIDEIASALRDQDRWFALDDPEHPAPRDGTRILVVLNNPVPKDWNDWDGIPFVARHPGIAKNGFDIGWSFAAPVGCGGFPDEWIAGWRPLPLAPQPSLSPFPDAGGGDG